MNDPNPNGGLAVVQALRDNDVDVVFGIPGTHNLEIYRHLPGSGIRHVAPRHEQGAGYAADGYARVSGKPGVVLTTSGPGLTNACTPAATAYADSIPVLMISPGVPRGMERADIGWLHEMKDQQAHLDCLVDRSVRVHSAEEAYQAIDEAFGRWRVSRPRPVHVEIPLDVLDGSAILGDLRSGPRSYQAPSADALDLDRAADALSTARELVVVAGGGSRRAAGPLRRLVEGIGGVVITTVNGKGVLPETHGQSLGASIRLREAQHVIDSADVLLVVGSELGDADLWGGTLSPRGTTIRIDIDPAQLQKNMPATIALHGDAAATLAALCDRLGERPDASGPAADRARELRATFDESALREGRPWLPFHQVLREALPTDTIVAGDSAKVSYFGTIHQWPMNYAGQFIYPAGYATLGYGLPAAIGAKLARPDAPVVALVGDGGTMFTIQEFMTAVDLGLPLPVIVMNNGGYGEIRDEMEQRGIAPQAVDVRSPDFPALGRAFGGQGVRVHTPDELGVAVTAALGRDTPTLIEVPVIG